MAELCIDVARPEPDYAARGASAGPLIRPSGPITPCLQPPQRGQTKPPGQRSVASAAWHCSSIPGAARYAGIADVGPDCHRRIEELCGRCRFTCSGRFAAGGEVRAIGVVGNGVKASSAERDRPPARSCSGKLEDRRDVGRREVALPSGPAGRSEDSDRPRRALIPGCSESVIDLADSDHTSPACQGAITSLRPRPSNSQSYRPLCSHLPVSLTFCRSHDRSAAG